MGGEVGTTNTPASRGRCCCGAVRHLGHSKRVGPSATETEGNSLCMPDWFEARLGTDDMLDAFRQLPVFSAHRTLNTPMWCDTSARSYHFAVVKGMVFGRS